MLAWGESVACLGWREDSRVCCGGWDHGGDPLKRAAKRLWRNIHGRGGGGMIYKLQKKGSISCFNDMLALYQPCKICWQAVKLDPNPIGWKSTLTRWRSLQSGPQYWFLIFDCVSSSKNKWKNFSSAQDWQSSALQRSTDLVLITHNSMWLGHSCPASTVPQQMLPCCGCHPGQDHVTQNRVQRARSTAGTAQRGGGATECVGQPCRISHINISFSLD